MFNFFFMWLWIDLPFLTIAYAFFPLVFALYIKGIEEKKGFIYSALLAVLWTILLSSGYGIPWAATNWMAIFSFFLFSIIVYKSKERIKHAIVFTVSLLGSWIALNAFWLIPLSNSFAGELSRNALPGVNISELFAKNSVSVANGLRFLGPPDYLLGSYNGSPYFPWYNMYNTPALVIISFLVPSLVVLSLFTKKNKNLIFFGLFTVFFLFLVKGSNPPLGLVNSFLFSQTSLDFVFRSVYQRFMGYVVLGSAVLITFSVDWIARLRAKRRMLSFCRGILLVSLSISLVVILPNPLWTGAIYDQSGVFSSRRVTIPDYYFEAAKWLDDQDGQFNVLPLPFPIAYKTAFSWDNGSTGYYSKYPFAFISSHSFIINDFGNETGSTFVRLMIDETFNDSSILNLFNIRYIFLHRDANWQYVEGNPNWVSGSLQQLQAALKSMKGLILENSFGEIDVYRNIFWQPMEAYSLPKALLGETETSLSSKDVVYFDQLASPSQWSSATGNWAVYFEDGQSFVNGTDASILELDIMSTNDLTTEGYFKFGETDSVHYPFVLTNKIGATFCPVVAGANGYFVETGTDQISKLMPYYSDRWYNITLNQDLEKNKYWLWIDNNLLTPPEGLTMYLNGGNPVSSSQENFVKVAIVAGGTLRPSSTEIHNVKIFDQESERNLVANYMTTANLIKQAKIVTIKKMDPTQYEGNIDVTKPSLLVLNENYDSGWILKVDGTEFKPSVGFDFNNLYSIDATGRIDLAFYYTPQNWFYAGTIVTLCFLSFLVGYLFFTKRHQIKMWISDRFSRWQVKTQGHSLNHFWKS
jgi:hypothetical protein